MNQTLSLVIVYPLHVNFDEEIRPVLEEVLRVQLVDLPLVVTVGSTNSALVEVEMPSDFDVRRMKTHVKKNLPDVSMRIVTRFRESIWAKRRIDVLVAVASGVAVAAVIDGALPLLPGWP